MRTCDKCGAELNADGDSMAVLKAAQKRFGEGAVENEGELGEWAAGYLWSFRDTVSRYRLAAKHAKTFNPNTMDLDVWRDAVWDRGDIVRIQYAGSDRVHYVQRGEWVLATVCTSITAITPAQHTKETAKVECFAREWHKEFGVYGWKCENGHSVESINAKGDADLNHCAFVDELRVSSTWHPITEAEYTRLPAQYAAKYAESQRSKDSPCPFCGSAVERNNITTRVRCGGNPNVCRLAQGMFFTPEQWEMRAGK